MKTVQDIQQFIDDSPNGVIYFSFGSIVKMDSFPAKMQNALREAFAELPQRILWKYDGNMMENQPNNVMIKKWFPQRDILGIKKNNNTNKCIFHFTYILYSQQFEYIGSNIVYFIIWVSAVIKILS